jgi:hypothetical protein
MVRHQDLIVGKYYKIGNKPLGYFKRRDENDILIFTSKPSFVRRSNHSIVRSASDNDNYHSVQVTDEEYGTNDSDISSDDSLLGWSFISSNSQSSSDSLGSLSSPNTNAYGNFKKSKKSKSKINKYKTKSNKGNKGNKGKKSRKHYS